MKYLLVVTALLLSNNAFCSQKSRTGMTLEVAVSGFLSPEIRSAKIINVEEDSPASEQGVVKGDLLIEIDGCQIPGCPASKVKEYMAAPTGTKLSMRFQRQSGESYAAEIQLR